MSWSRILLAIAAVMSAACERDDTLSKSLDGAFRNATAQPVDLAAHAAFPWDRVCVLRPYTTSDATDRLTGVTGASARAHGIQSRDDANVLVFVAGKEVVQSVAVARDSTDFDGESACYPRHLAVVEVRPAPAGRIARVVKRPD